MSTAKVTQRTIVAPATIVWVHVRMATMTRLRSARMCAKPPLISLSTPLPPSSSGPVSASSGVGRSTSRATGWMPETRNAERRKVATLRKKTVGTLVAVTSSAPSAGPMKNARLSMVLEAPFAAVSSAGLLVSDGIQDIWAGRKTEPPRAARVATTRTDKVGASTSTSTAATDTRQARTRSEPMRIAFRGRRSASDEPSGAATAMSRRRIAPQMPMSLTPPAP